MAATLERRMPAGAEPLPGGGVHFRVWAAGRSRVDVVFEAAADAPPRAALRLQAEGNGYFAGVAPEARSGTRYRYRMDGDDVLLPDPASRYQPEGPHGASEVIDPDSFRWTDAAWRGVPPEDRILYELHIGTFTPEGTWHAAIEQLPALAELGVTLLEVMPVADFPGRFGWGYDGVNLFAPTRLYGDPDDFRRFVDRAHAAGLGVILDVVYNHLGPDGNYLGRFSPRYFSDRYETDWGRPFNFDGPGCGPVREYILANAAYWVREFHVDGYRLDAVQAIFDRAAGEAHIIAQIGAAARAAAGARRVYVIAESEPQQSMHVRPCGEGGHGLDAAWNDDWHHSATVALTGRKEAYYSDHLGAPAEFVAAAKYGYLYQGQHYGWQQQRRGTTALDLPPTAFINYLQNHDQVANSARGDRCHRLASPAELRALTALLILGPATPLLFMGQEFAASAPFLYFADHEPRLAEAVQRGRRAFLRQFPSLALPELQEHLDDPADPATFARCRLDPAERERNAPVLALHRDLIRLRRGDATLRTPRHRSVDGAVLGAGAFVLRWFGTAPRYRLDRLLLVNLGRELQFAPAPEPLLAPPDGCCWSMLWSSEAVAYGGLGHPPPESADGRWAVPGHCAVLLSPQECGR